MATNNQNLIKVEKVVRTALGLLEREVVLPALVWRDAGGSFAGAKDDTISLRLPGIGTARERDLRSADGYLLDGITETKVDVTLDKDVYGGTKISDEELTLDVENFGEQILQPIVGAVARKIEDDLAATMSGATYPFEVAVDPAGATGLKPYAAAVRARKFLNKANVPTGGRRLVVGADLEEVFLTDDQFVKANESGSDSALREAQIGRVAGMDVFVTNSIPADEAYMFHQTAYVLSLQAPVVPSGVTYGSSASFAGLAMRIIRDYDFVNIQDRLVANTYMGTNVVQDRGTLEMVDLDGDGTGTATGPTGKFTPSVNGTDPLQFVRAVKLALVG